MFRRRKTAKPWVSQQFIDAARSRPDHMIVTQTCLIVYHSGTDKVLIIPHENRNITNAEAEALLNERLKQYNRKIKS